MGTKRRAATKRDQAVHVLLKALLTGTYQPGRTPREVAAKFGVSSRRAEAWATEARTIVRFGRGTRDDIRSEIICAIERAVAGAFESVTYLRDKDGHVQGYKKPDFEALRTFLEMLIDVHGLGSDREIDAPIDELRRVLFAQGLEIREIDGKHGQAGVATRQRGQIGAGQAGLPPELDPAHDKS